MPETWLTYRQLGDHWKTSPEAARARSRRGHYKRRTNNKGAVEVLVDTDAPVVEPRQKAQAEHSRTATPNAESPPAATAEALGAMQSHIDTLKAELAKAEALAADRGREVAVERERVADLTAQLLKITADLLDARKAETARPRGWWARLVG